MQHFSRLVFVVILSLTSLTALSAAAEYGVRFSSPAFAPYAEIPLRYTGEGENISPPLSWSGFPPLVKSLVLLVEDPDAPDPAAPQTVFVHWLVYNLSPNTKGLAEGVRTLPPGAEQGLNDNRQLGYTGPMPPIGRHRYFFRLYGLDEPLHFTHAPTKADVEGAIQGHIVDESEFMGTYQLQRQ